MPELRFLLAIISELLRLVVGAFLLRFLLQAVRADFRNPVAQAIVRFTNPVVLPLRKILPPIGRTDTASIVAVLLVQFVVCAGLHVLTYGLAGLSAGALFADAVILLLGTALSLYQVAIIVYVLMSWINTGGYNPVGRLLGQLCEPVLAPFRRALPAPGGLDISPIVVLLLIWLLQLELDTRVAPLLRDLLG